MVWALSPLWTIGYGTPFTVAYGAVKLRSRALAWSATGYAAAIVAAVPLLQEAHPGPEDRIGVGLVVAVIMLGLVQSLAVRTDLFDLDTFDADVRRRRRALRIAGRHPRQALRMHIGRIDVPATHRMPDGGLIDVNNVAAPALTDILPLDGPIADGFSSKRDEIGGFLCVAELEMEMRWDPHRLDAVRSRLIFLPSLGCQHSEPPRRPRATQIVADGRHAEPPLVRPSTGVMALSWLWATAPLWSVSLLACPVIAFAAARLRSRALWLSSGAYLAGAMCLVTFGQSAPSLVVVAICVAASAQAIALREDVFELDIVRADRQARHRARRIVGEDPQEAVRLKIGRVDVPQEERYPDGGLIDVNNSSVESLRLELGLDQELVQEIADARSALWGFKSLPDLSVHLGLVPQLFDAVEDRLVFLPLIADRCPSPK